MKKGPNLFFIALIFVSCASTLVLASPEANKFLQQPFKIKLFNFGEQMLSIAPSYDLSETFSIQSESVSGLDAGKRHVEEYMNGFKEEIVGLEDEIEGIENTAQGIKTEIKDYQTKQEKMIEEVAEEAKDAPAEKLAQYESDKVDVAETIYEGNVPIQKDIFTHSKELYKDKNDPDSFGVMPI